MTDAEFHEWLRMQFTTLEEAKHWARCWMLNGEIVPLEGGGGLYSMRAMSAHISMALERKEMSADEWLTSYLDEKYGPAIFDAMTDPTFDPR